MTLNLYPEDIIPFSYKIVSTGLLETIWIDFGEEILRLNLVNVVLDKMT